jgi:hypothetical protein
MIRPEAVEPNSSDHRLGTLGSVNADVKFRARSTGMLAPAV